MWTKVLYTHSSWNRCVTSLSPLSLFCKQNQYGERSSQLRDTAAWISTLGDSEWEECTVNILHVAHLRFHLNPPKLSRKQCYHFPFLVRAFDRLCGLVVSSWLQIQRSWVQFPALPDFLRSSGSETGSTQPREYN
jgi:hypothetical protein